VALMDGVRARIKDKRVLALVQAFLKAGAMTARGGREETLTGTPLSVAFHVRSSRYPACSMFRIRLRNRLSRILGGGHQPILRPGELGAPDPLHSRCSRGQNPGSVPYLVMVATAAASLGVPGDNNGTIAAAR
jgi:hypothetical protein